MSTTHQKTIYEKYIKTPLDVLLALLALVALSPVILVTALLVRCRLGAPVLFKQPRPGRNGKIFMLCKFRSMSNQTNQNGELLPDEVRLGRFGKALRASSLDELPSLLNIVRGQLAVVGPRPQLVRDMTFMTPEQRRRHEVRPGLTGLAQVNGRNNITWEQKFAYDLQYVDGGITFLGDLRIIIQTIGKVLKRNDTVREGTVSDMDYGDWLMMEGKVDQATYDEKQKEARELLGV